jgi:hypothetical protein
MGLFFQKEPDRIKISGRLTCINKRSQLRFVHSLAVGIMLVIYACCSRAQSGGCSKSWPAAGNKEVDAGE